MSQSKLYVGNLSFEATESNLRDTFSPFGDVQSVHIVSDRETSRPRGFAFVEMASDGEAQAAIDGLNGTDYQGRSLTVSIAKPRENRGFGGGGRDHR